MPSMLMGSRESRASLYPESTNVADGVFHGVVARLEHVRLSRVAAALGADAFLQLDEEEVLVGALAQRRLDAAVFCARAAQGPGSATDAGRARCSFRRE